MTIYSLHCCKDNALKSFLSPLLLTEKTHLSSLLHITSDGESIHGKVSVRVVEIKGKLMPFKRI